MSAAGRTGHLRMAEAIAVAVITLLTLLAVISPGADFAVVVRNSCLYGRPTGLFAAAVVAAGVLVHVSYTMLGVGLLIASSTALFTAIKLAGAAYPVWIGIRTFRAPAELTVDLESAAGLTRAGALRSGHPRVAAGGLRAVHVGGAPGLVRGAGAVLLGLAAARPDAEGAEGVEPGDRLGTGGAGGGPGVRPLSRVAGAGARSYLSVACAA